MQVRKLKRTQRCEMTVLLPSCMVVLLSYQVKSVLIYRWVEHFTEWSC